MTQPAMNINIPLDWRPRQYQMALWERLEGGTKRACMVWHRRAGKDSTSLNWTITQAFKRRGLYWHILPTYKQGRRIVWEGMTKEGRPFLSYWPTELVRRRRDDEMTLWLRNGSMWQVIGAETQEDINKLVGANPVGVVFSEYSLCLPAVWDFVRPILAENGGWALFIYTPRGRNHGYQMKRMAEKNPDWFFQTLTVDDTKAISTEAIQAERDAGMPEELIQQEFYCSFDAPLVGSYYGDLMTKMADEGRILEVPHEPDRPVITSWDLGIGDSTAIWFWQQIALKLHLIRFYEASGVGIDHYAKMIHELPYTYSDHLAPHDAQSRELGTGKTLVETARNLGIRFRVVPKLSVEHGINAVRLILPKVWADEEKCEHGLQALREYTKERMLGAEGPDGTPVFRPTPRHDWTSHAADSLRYGAIGLRPPLGPRKRRLAPKLAIV